MGDVHIPGLAVVGFHPGASFRPSCSVMRQSTSRAPPSSLIRVEVDGGQVAGPTASSKPGTALGIGLGSTTNTSKSRLIASSGSADSGGQRTPGPLCPRGSMVITHHTHPRDGGRASANDLEPCYRLRQPGSDLGGLVGDTGIEPVTSTVSTSSIVDFDVHVRSR